MFRFLCLISFWSGLVWSGLFCFAGLVSCCVFSTVSSILYSLPSRLHTYIHTIEAHQRTHALAFRKRPAHLWANCESAVAVLSSTLLRCTTSRTAQQDNVDRCLGVHTHTVGGYVHTCREGGKVGSSYRRFFTLLCFALLERAGVGVGVGCTCTCTYMSVDPNPNSLLSSAQLYTVVSQ